MDGTQAHGLPARPRKARHLTGLLGWSGSTPAISPDPDGQPAGGVAYGVAYGHHNGPIPAVLSVAVVRLGHTSVFQVRRIRPLCHLSACEFVLNVRPRRRRGL